ncbi:MAG: beta-Ala-His dipeptidase [Clostridia bacterium]|nr:beta-Ala-His dipeptidase [Clostridia bacterium]
MYIQRVKNERPFEYFEIISRIPRASGNEGEIANYLLSFADKHNLYAIKDEANNVLIVKNATQGRENEPSIMLQAHTDMVAEKNKETIHDFSKDPIELIQEGNILRANNTTLGADDGFGVAIMLSILEDESISHPKIECLFTSSEEIGLVGASKFDYSQLTAKRMVNLDSAEENSVIIGCCGGIRTELTLPVKREKGVFNGYKITIGGLCGGHSGEDIDKNRLNAHILMGKILSKLKSEIAFNISYISGGDKDNAIPRECECVIIADKEIDGGEINDYARSFLKASEDNELCVKIEKTTTSQRILDDDTDKIIKVLLVDNGVLEYRKAAPILPRLSRNLARIRTNENNISIGFSSRCYEESGLKESVEFLNSLANEIGGDTYHHEKYPGWQSPASSPLVTSWQGAYEKVSGEKTEATLIHAGLECGIISAGIKDLEAISVGCNVHDLHTPQETMEIKSMDKIYDTVVEFLKNI